MVVGFTNLLIVAAAAFAAPLALGLVPVFRLPAVVLEIVLGIVLGPSVLGWAKVDEPVQVMSLLGLAFLLLLAGLEVEFEQFRGRLLKLTGVGFAASLGIALVFALGLHEAGLVKSPLLIGIIADVATIVLLSLFFSGHSSGLGAKLSLLGAFVALAAAVGLAVVGAERSIRLSGALLRLQDTTAQIRVRGAFVLLVGFVVLAERFGLEAILGAFMAGFVLKLVDRDRAMTHTHFHQKLGEAGFGIFVPFIVVASQIGMDLGLITKGTGAAFVAAGLVSVLVFPLTALSLLRAGTASQAVATA